MKKPRLEVLLSMLRTCARGVPCLNLGNSPSQDICVSDVSAEQR